MLVVSIVQARADSDVKTTFEDVAYVGISSNRLTRLFMLGLKPFAGLLARVSAYKQARQHKKNDEEKEQGS